MGRNRLPPLNSIRVFEAAARYNSFSRAAEELHVTNAAVSYQIKQLEEFLNLELFRRDNNQLTLTSAGERYAPRIREALRAVMEATDFVLADQSIVLHLAVPPAFGTKWLVPRLFRFLNSHPEIRVEVTSTSAFDPARDRYDVVISTLQRPSPGFHREAFITVKSYPVCSPKLLEGKDALHEPADLAHHALLHEKNARDDATKPDWPAWLRTHRVKGVDENRGQNFPSTMMVLQAAIDGQGVALAKSVLIEHDIAAGRLACPFPLPSPADYTYSILYRNEILENPALAALRAWLLAEASASSNATAKSLPSTPTVTPWKQRRTE